MEQSNSPTSSSTGRALYYLPLTGMYGEFPQFLCTNTGLLTTDPFHILYRSSFLLNQELIILLLLTLACWLQTLRSFCLIIVKVSTNLQSSAFVNLRSSKLSIMLLPLKDGVTLNSWFFFRNVLTISVWMCMLLPTLKSKAVFAKMFSWAVQ